MSNETDLIKSMFEKYLYSSGVSPRYEVSVISLDDINGSISAEFKFLRNETYCCGEITCHFKPDWNRIREIALSNGLMLSKPLSIKFEVSVESGTKLETNPTIGLPLEVKGYQYTELYQEKIS